MFESILGTVPYLSGLTPDTQKSYLRLYNEHTQPVKAKRLRAMIAAKAKIERDAGKVFAAMEKAVGGRSDRANNIRMAQTAAEKALSA